MFKVSVPFTKCSFVWIAGGKIFFTLLFNNFSSFWLNYSSLISVKRDIQDSVDFRHLIRSISILVQQPGTYSETELVSLLKNRDQQAFSRLYDQYSGALNNIIFRMTGDEALSEDILQEAFLKIWNNIHSYDDGKGRLFTWMLNLTRNLTIDTLRSKGYKNAQKTTGQENFVNTIADDKSGSDRFDSLGVQKLVKKLKPEQQLIIDLGYFQGYTQDEISRAMNIPLGTVKTRMRAGILELRKLILDTSS